MIRIDPHHLIEIGRHGEAEYPNECCGLLIGRLENDGLTRVVTRTYAVINQWKQEEQKHRMLISPLDYMRAERESIDEGLGVVGNYHSHPDHPAVPSQFDLEHAPWSTFSYIVVSVIEGQARDLRSWEIPEDRSRFIEEVIVKGSESCL